MGLRRFVSARRWKELLEQPHGVDPQVFPQSPGTLLPEENRTSAVQIGGYPGAEHTYSRLGFFAVPRYLARSKPKIRLSTQNVCSTLARTPDLSVFLRIAASST